MLVRLDALDDFEDGAAWDRFVVGGELPQFGAGFGAAGEVAGGGGSSCAAGGSPGEGERTDHGGLDGDGEDEERGHGRAFLSAGVMTLIAPGVLTPAARWPMLVL